MVFRCAVEYIWRTLNVSWILLLGLILLAQTLYAQQTNTMPVTLTWTDPNPDNSTSSEDGFSIRRDGKEIAKVGKNVTTFKDTVTGPVGVDVCYEVAPYNKAGSTVSNKSCKTMP